MAKNEEIFELVVERSTKQPKTNEFVKNPFFSLIIITIIFYTLHTRTSHALEFHLHFL